MTIEETRKSNPSPADLRDAIVELACELRRSDSTTDSKLCDAVDAYHEGLRKQARE